MILPILLEIPEGVPGARVLLRPFRREDAQAVWEAKEESFEHLRPWLPWAEKERSLEDTIAFIARARARWLLREDLTVGIFHRASNRFLGASGLHRINWPVRLFEIGYWIRASEEGRGYVTETVQALTRLAFEVLGANRVEIRMDPRNVRSKKIPEQLGFTLEGTLRRCALGSDGEATDRHIFALIREDYARLPWATPG